MARLSRRLGVPVAAVAATVGLASCGGGTNADALSACRSLTIAFHAYAVAQHARTPARRAAELHLVDERVSIAEADAAEANSQDGSYDAFMTQLQQAEEEPFGAIEPTLQASCDTITSPNNYL